MENILKKTIISDKSIRDTINKCIKWFEDNPERNICNANIFGHKNWKIHKLQIESNIKKAAFLAKNT